MALFNLILMAVLTALGVLKVDDPPKDPPPDPPKDPPKDPAKDDDDDDDADDDADDGADDGGDGGKPDLTGLTPEQLQARLTKARRDVKSAKGMGKSEREKREKAERQLSAIAAALGLKPEDNDPEKLQASLEATQGELRSEKVENALYREAVKQGAKPEHLLRWLKGGGELADLDPKSDTFKADLAQLVTDTLEEVGDLKVPANGAGAGKSGGEFGGAGSKTLDEQIEAARSKGDHKEAIRLQAEKLTSGTPGSS